jgi:magnesium-transporting ATPase (P-type)
MAATAAFLPRLGDGNGAFDLASLDAEEVFERLVTSQNGLTSAEATARLRQFGQNLLPRFRPEPWWISFGGNFTHLFALLLWFAAILAWLAGMPQLTFAIVLVVLINGFFSYWQQHRANVAVAALESLLPHRVSVRRDSQDLVVDSEQITVGDLLVLGAGSSVPADARIVVADGLRVDTSSLTGESRPVVRDAASTTVTSQTVTDLPNLLLAGTLVTAGSAQAVVFATGKCTEFGQLAALTFRQPDQPSPLQREVRKITRTITVVSLIMGLLFFAIGSGFGTLTAAESFVFALGIIVANVPEGLLPTITMALALGVRRMAARNAIVKRLDRVEALGAVTTIVTDKTGTLTKNEMTVRSIWCGCREYEITGTGYGPAGSVEEALGGDVSQGNARDIVNLLQTAALCCDARVLAPNRPRGSWRCIGDPTEAAIIVAGEKAGVTEESVRQFVRLAEIPFDSSRRRMSTVQQGPDGILACTKGAVTEVLRCCNRIRGETSCLPLTDQRREQVLSIATEMAQRGLRVLAIATRPLTNEEDFTLSDTVEQQLILLGLVGMEDPPRDEVPGAIAACKAAGIRVIMATGDDGRTAEAIGRQVGLYREQPRVITGVELDQMSDDVLALALASPQVIFARVTPTHKLRLVETLQRRGEVVALTGDGVNDAPALKRTDIGVAMGATGTDVAREAADMILLDDNFATIVAAVEEGRAVYDNVRKFLTYILASNVPEIIPFIAFVLFRIPLPLTVMQILAIDLGTDLLPALALGSEKPEPKVMRRPPRRRDQRLLDRATLVRSYAWLGLVEAGLSLAGFFFVFWTAGWRFGEPLADAGSLYVMATTMTLAGIVACQAGNALACRSPRESLFSIGVFSNRPLLAAIVVEGLLLLLLIWLPPLAYVFHTTPLEPVHWLLLATFGPLVVTAEECRKYIARHVASRTNGNDRLIDRKEVGVIS